MLNVYHMFLGKEPLQIAFLFEIIIRTTVMYFYTLVNIRVFRPRPITQQTSFELIIIIALGTALADPMFYPQIPLVVGMIAVTLLVLLTKIVAMLTEKSTILEKLIEGQPTLIIKNGTILKEQLHNIDLSEEELFEKLRLQGIKNIGHVEYAFIEASGQLSVIKDKNPKEGISTLNHIE